MNPNILNIVAVIAPLVIGCVIALINSDKTNNYTEKIELWIRRKQRVVSQKSNWFFRYIINPILWLIVKFSDWTDGFAHRGLKNGVRIAITFYLIAAWCFLIYTVFMIAITILIIGVILYIVLKVLEQSNSDFANGVQKGKSMFKTQSKNNPINLVGQKGKKIYSGTNWFNEELAGRVDEEGNIYKGSNWLNEEKIGRIDDDGNIIKGTNWFNEEKVGRIDDDGNIIKGTNWFNEEKTGRIDDDGNIQKGSSWWTEEKKGRIE